MEKITIMSRNLVNVEQLLKKTLSYSEVRQWKDYLNWDKISDNCSLEYKDFFREYKDILNWTAIMERSDISEKQKEQFIKEFNLVQVQGFTWYGTSKIMWYILVGGKI